MLTAIDLFSGCGGLTLGLKRAGFKVVAAVEIDKLAADTYHLNHEEVHLERHDIRRVRPYTLMRRIGLRPGELGLLAGCPPCQGFSSLRTLNGARNPEDERNDLLFQFIRFVRAMRPRAVMMENVPALAADARFDEFRDELAKLGYGRGDFRHLNAADFGVPQRRKRLVFMAIRGERQPIFADPLTERETVRGAIGALPEPGTTDDSMHAKPGKRSKRVERLISLVPKDGGSRKDLPLKYQLDCHKRCDGFKDVYGRMSWDDVAPTITGGCFNPSKGRFLHPTQNRNITMREAALLQGFPLEYKFPSDRSISDIALLIGNAFPPNLVAAQAEVLADTLRALS